jgi:diaminopimelate epimerase
MLARRTGPPERRRVGSGRTRMLFVNASKYHSYGNAYFVAPADQIPDDELDQFTSDICDPHFGIGGDGCVFIARTPDRLIKARIFNPDGSEAGMSGNGIRCAAACLHHDGWVEADEVEILTPSGRKVYSLLESGELTWTYRALMGAPAFDSRLVPFASPEPLELVQRHAIEAGGESLLITALSVGNPQCAVLVDELPERDRFLRLGAALESHPSFPERTNVSFVRVTGPHDVTVLLYERGVGPTHSSGTGSCGAAIAAILAGRVQSPVTVHTATGAQTVEWAPGQEVALTGTAEFIGRIVYCWRQDD